jgi:hypothetical protein
MKKIQLRYFLPSSGENLQLFPMLINVQWAAKLDLDVALVSLMYTFKGPAIII